jgi:O-antigen ligase
VRTWPTPLAAWASGAAAFLVLLLYSPALHAPFLVPKFAALEVTASLGFVAFALQRFFTGRPRWTGAVTAAVMGVLATTALAWAAAAAGARGAPYAIAALARWGSLFGIACGVSVLSDAPAARQRVLEAIAIAAAVVAATGLLQHVEWMPLGIPVISKPGSTFGNRNLAAEAIAMALPLGVGAAARCRPRALRTALWTSLALQIVYLAVTRTRGAWLGAACGLGASLWLARIRLSWSSVAVAIGVALVAAMAATLPGRFNPRDAGDSKRYEGVVEVLQESVDAQSTAVRTRLGLWRRTLSMVREGPLVGVGPGNWPVVFPRYAEPGATQDGVLSPTVVPRQAHNDLLERAAETGMVGLAAFLLWVGAVGASVRRSLQTADADGRACIAAAAGALVALGVMSLSSFPLEMPGTLCLAGLALGVVAVDVQGRTERRKGRAGGGVVVVLGGVLVACAALRAERSVRGSWWVGRAERSIRADRGSAGAEQGLAALKHALEAAPNDFTARLLTARLLLRAGRPAASVHAAEQVHALEPYSPNAWAVLSAAELALNDAAAARWAADQALGLLEDYPEALDLRAQASAREGDVGAAAADRDHLARLARGPASSAIARSARAVLERAQ